MPTSQGLVIPSAQRAAVERLARMPDGDLSVVEARLRELQIGASAADVAQTLASINGLTEPQQLADAIVGADVLRSSLSWSLTDAAEAVAESPSLDLNPSERDLLSTRLVRLLDLPPLWRTARAYDLGTAHHRSLQTARIITDIRPVFSDDVDQLPTSVIISHSLALQTYESSGAQKIEYLTLDDGDLAALAVQVERAQRKAETLRRFALSAGAATHKLEIT